MEEQNEETIDPKYMNIIQQIELSLKQKNIQYEPNVPYMLAELFCRKVKILSLSANALDNYLQKQEINKSDVEILNKSMNTRKIIINRKDYLISSRVKPNPTPAVNEATVHPAPDISLTNTNFQVSSSNGREFFN